MKSGKGHDLNQLAPEDLSFYRNILGSVKIDLLCEWVKEQLQQEHIEKELEKFQNRKVGFFQSLTRGEGQSDLKEKEKEIRRLIMDSEEEKKATFDIPEKYCKWGVSFVQK